MLGLHFPITLPTSCSPTQCDQLELSDGELDLHSSAKFNRITNIINFAVILINLLFLVVNLDSSNPRWSHCVGQWFSNCAPVRPRAFTGALRSIPKIARSHQADISH